MTKNQNPETRSKSGVRQILQRLAKQYPGAHCALHHKNSFELLVATILSAQCTDERVNKVTPKLFSRFPNPKEMAGADLKELEQLIGSINFFKNKSKHLKSCAEDLVTNHGAEVPRVMEELICLAGVGRKTANVVLGNAFNIASGVVVDTHVGRLSYRLAWTKEKTAVAIEQDLLKIIPEDQWIILPHYLIFHGRQVCKARRPLCESCFLFDLCPKKGV